MRRPTPLLTCALLALLAGAQPPTPAASLDRELRAAVERGDVPGLVVIAGTRNGVLHHAAFGLAESAAHRAMTTDAIFRIASMTKAVTSVALMQLVEEKRVSLDDPAAKYLPELAHPPVLESLDDATGAYRLRPAASPITVRHLLTHTSGLGAGFISATLAKFKPREGEKPAVGPLLFDPGTQWIYGSSTEMVGRIVEKLSGRTLEDYFQEKILRPLRMTDTSYNVPAEKQARLVNTHRRGADGTLTEQPRRAPQTATRFNGSGGLYSTAGDYLRFLRMLLNGGELDGTRILQRETVALMQQNHIGTVGVRALKTTAPEVSRDFTFVDDNRDKWGLGFQIATTPAAGKRSPGSLSWGGINNTYFWYDPQRGVAGVIMMQFMPFADEKALAIYDTFERGVYRLIGK